MPRSRLLRRSVLMLTSTSSLVALGLVVVLLGAFALRLVDKPRFLRIAVAPSGSADSQFVQAMARDLPKGFPSSSIRMITGQTLEEASEAVDADYADLAIVRTDVAMPRRAGTLLVVHRDAALFMATAASKVKQIADLEGKKVGIVPGHAANATLLGTVLDRYGIETGTVARVPLEFSALKGAVARKEVDAVVVVAPVESEEMTEAVAAMEEDDVPPTFLPIEVAEALENGPYGLVKIDIPAGAFPDAPPQPEGGVQTVGVEHQLVARYSMSEAAAGLITRTTLERRRLLARDAPIARHMEAPDTNKGSLYPLHPGATAYFADNEKSFMDRYGDWFYIVAMALGGLGSIAASVIGSLQARSRRRGMVFIDKLTQLRRQAADSADQAGLRGIDRDVSELALSALLHAREGRFDREGLQVLRLAIDETRRTITRRLAELRSGGPVDAQLPVRAAEPVR